MTSSNVQSKPTSNRASSPTAQHVAHRRGFTIIELLTAVGISMVLAAIAIPHVMNAVYLSRLRSAADGVSALIQQARSMAEQNNATIPVYILNDSVGPGNLSGAFISCISGTCPGGTAWVASDRYVVYGGGVTNSTAPPAALPQASLGFTTQAGTVYFTPLGMISNLPAGTYTSQGFAFYLTDARNNWAAISVSPTGRSKVWLYTAGSWH